MESYNKFEIKPNQNEYIYDYNLGTNNLNNANIQKENEIKFDMLLDGILLNNKQNNSMGSGISTPCC